MKILQRLLTMIWLMAAMTATAQPRYDRATMQHETLNRGVVALKSHDGRVYVTWRLLADECPDEGFDVYRNGKRLNKKSLTKGGTFFEDRSPLNSDATYEVRGGKVNGNYTLKADAPTEYLSLKLDKPKDGTTPDGQTYEYLANDASIGDADGDGQYEIYLKWEPSNYHDNAHPGFTGPVLIDCYTLEGKKLWRINLGNNIRAGAHYTQFMVYDFDGDGRCELICKTADGTTDSEGKVIGDGTKDWRCYLPADREPTKEERNRLGRILDGPEYLTVFDGLTGRALCTADYIPARGDIKAWGDNYGNRSDRFLAGVAYLDGRHASAIFCRGYYTRSVQAAWDWDGHELKSRWVFDTDNPEWKDYAGQGNHNLRIADVDADGKDEIIYGAMAVDDDGRGLYNTGFGHGDALHLVAEPDGRLYIWDCHENKRDGVELRHAGSGEVVFQNKSTMDVGRCMAADIDPTNPGTELWSVADPHLYNTQGKVIREKVGGQKTCNFGIWWDDDLLRELLDKESVLKYDWKKNEIVRLRKFDGCKFNNWTKSTPCLQADILGDWREEVITRTEDNSELRIYVSPYPTKHRIVCLEEDIPYRLSVATENVGYNQPPEPGFYIGGE